MKKVTIEFEVNDRDEEAELRRILHATDAYCVLHSMLEHLRAIDKWSEDPKEAEFAEKAREYLYAQMESCGVTMEDLP
jgi:hypothetical protein